MSEIGNAWSHSTGKSIGILQKMQWLENEVKRLKEGRFTEEEFQNLCRNFSEDDACRFASGCIEYNMKLFGDKARLKPGTFYGLPTVTDSKELEELREENTRLREKNNQLERANRKLSNSWEDNVRDL